MKKILLVFGTRPEAIKMCPLIKCINDNSQLECCVCLTGQHKEMLDQVMDEFGIKADYNMKIMKENQTLSDITSEIITKLDPILEKENPQIVLVHGDTTTSFAAALSAFYHRIPIGHVEAGLRTYLMDSPYPEEFNRQAVDLICDLYFAPTQLAKQNLLREGKKEEKIYVTGNTVIDALKTTVNANYSNPILDWCKGSRMILLTAHRRENIGENMHQIFQAVKRIVHDNPDVKVIYPVHKNPKVLEIANEVFKGEEQIKLIEPLDVIDFHNLMAHSYLILTDSGGIQEEAPSLGKPVLVVRNTTERPEGVSAGTLKLAGTKEAPIYKEIDLLLRDSEQYDKMSKASNPYGDGHASERIVEGILAYLRK